jgi:hypothetical protein
VPTAPPDLTETTVRYVFAASWLPSSDSERLVAVPGGATKALDTASSLLHIALWALRRDRVIDFEQLRPIEDEPVRAFGGRSFSRFTLLDRTARRAGLEGALIQAAATVGPAERWHDRKIADASKEDHYGMRLLIRALDLDNRGPWKTVLGHCYAEAHAAGLVGMKGRLLKRLIVTDPAAVEALRARHGELRAARSAYMDQESELSMAVASDCLRVIADGFSPGGGDNL